ncbi:hypothetical protein N7462_000582 [Penicillium macrosclerotiorum]|uniref:uncharacterized protein n=1 Tax=Penicillium macrosclerotiorum TaxID=303699 RepID=UPI00254737B9|nr:uncharacterized protein N7462_000582 [Penicillium macrosclerotiorum]KAJ5698577.1 hypothetical protein N7462_000582 [Penicillium macrosclerotiorum]
MHFLDLSTFPVNGPKVDATSISDPHSVTAGQVDTDVLRNDSLRYFENLTGPELLNPSDFLLTSSWSGMIQVNLWSIQPPPALMDPEHIPNRTEDDSDNIQGLPRSMLNLLSLEDILAMEDYGHVARVRREQVEKLTSLMTKNQNQQILGSSPSCGELLSNPQIINSFVQLYFEYFHHTLTVLHKATFNVSEEPPLLILAVATIGGRFSKIPQAHTVSTVLGDICVKQSRMWYISSFVMIQNPADRSTHFS